MRKTVFISATLACLFPLSVLAQTARVISSTAIIEQIHSPRTVCSQQQVLVNKPQQKSGAGAIMGAIAGGAIGNQVGKGSGRAVATAAGLIGGAMLGDRLEGGDSSTVSQETVQNCVQENGTQSRVKGYRVTYEYAGRTYETEYPVDPGSSIPIQISPVFPR